MGDITKAIICICCGKRFFVDRDEYEERKEDSLCDKCRIALDEMEKIDDNDVFTSISQTVKSVATTIGGKIDSILKERAQNNTAKETAKNASGQNSGPDESLDDEDECNE